MRDKLLAKTIIGCSLAFVGCTNDDTPLAPCTQEICVQGATVVSSLSRDDTNTQPLPETYDMWLAAVFHNASNTSHEYFFQTADAVEMEFLYDPASLLWKLDAHTIYFPLNGAMDMLGYAVLDKAHKPVASFSPSALSSSSPTISALKLDFADKLNGTDPVVFSDFKSFACGGITVASLPTLNFRHALSKIVFTLRTTDSPTASRFNLYGITIKDVNLSGILDISPGNPSVGIWSSVGSAADVELPGISTKVNPMLVTSDSELGNPVGTQLYLPTQNGVSTLSAVIDYSISNGNNNTEIPRELKTIDIALPSGNWLPGMQYTYSLTVTLTEITSSCTSIGAIIDTAAESLEFKEIY